LARSKIRTKRFSIPDASSVEAERRTALHEQHERRETLLTVHDVEYPVLRALDVDDVIVGGLKDDLPGEVVLPPRQDVEVLKQVIPLPLLP
jgi:hypothetical protein